MGKADRTEVEVQDLGTQWVDEEISGAQMPDARLKARLGEIMRHLGKDVTNSIPSSFEDWAATKAAYRMLSNDRVDVQAIISGHLQATRRRVQQSEGQILVLHDTTSFTFDRLYPEDVGFLGRLAGAEEETRICGMLMHASLAITQDALPLGLCALQFWNRQEFSKDQAAGRAARKRVEDRESHRWVEGLQQATALLQAESGRCVHIADRESDIYALFYAARELGTHFLVRTSTDRPTGNGQQTVEEEMADAPVKGLHRVFFRDRWGHAHEATMTLRHRRLRIRPPQEHKELPELTLTVLHATERGAPLNRKPLSWKLITDLPVQSREQAIEKLDWYAMRWNIETFFKVMKSGCKAEDAQLRTAERLSNLMAVYCILSWRLMWMTMLNRLEPEADPRVVFTEQEIRALKALVTVRWKNKVPEPETLHDCVILVARLAAIWPERMTGHRGTRLSGRGCAGLMTSFWECPCDQRCGESQGQGRLLRENIRRRLEKYNNGFVPPELGFYGEESNKEWKQYQLEEEGMRRPDRCPFSHVSHSRKQRHAD